MRILITGGRGQLGRALGKALADDEVCAPGRDDLDVTDPECVRRVVDDLAPEVVIHTAAWTDTAGCEADAERAHLVNDEGTRLIAEACRRAGAAMVYVSTNEVFDGRKREPYQEDHEPRPINAYGRSKLAGERHVRSLPQRYRIVRSSWLYGAGRASFPEKVIRAAREAGRVRLVTDEVASPTWTADLAAAIARLIREDAWGTFHLTNSELCSRMEWGTEVLRLAGLGAVSVEAVTQSEFAAPYRKPEFSALANTSAAALGIEMRPWREALAMRFNEFGAAAIGGSPLPRGTS
jgi:dTDP-4-dehydrorhamnose reductase